MSRVSGPPRGSASTVPPRSADLFYAIREAFAEQLRGSPGTATWSWPVFEDTELFRRGVGESTDVVTKEMYTFERPRRPLADAAPRVHRLGAAAGAGARPAQGRAAGEGVVRRPHVPRRAAAGRAATGSSTSSTWRRSAARTRGSTPRRSRSPGTGTAPRADAGAAAAELARLPRVPPAYRALLQDFLRGLDLDEDTRARVEINPLRVLDDKRPRGAGSSSRTPR